jgi:isopenicillin-N N-acyltransferase-like protein
MQEYPGMKQIKEFKLVECSGTPYEIGLKWGEGCKDNLQTTTRNSLDTMASYLRLSKERIISMAMEHLTAIAAFDPYLVEIMRGQAAGADLSLEEIVAQKCMNDFTAKAMTGVSTLCTAFVATGSATEGGKTILAQNIDFVPDATIDFLKIHHADGLVQYILSFNNWTEYTFSSAGFGLCITATFAKEHEFTLPVSGYLSRVMRQKNIDEAFDLLKQVARGVACYHLADGSGKMYGIESTYNDFEVLQPQRDVFLHSNNYVTERFMARDTAPGIQPDSFDRLKTIDELIAREYGCITPATAMAVLADHRHRPNSICRHINEAVPISSKTLASFVMVPEDGAIYIAQGNPCESGFVRYAF